MNVCNCQPTIKMLKAKLNCRFMFSFQVDILSECVLIIKATIRSFLVQIFARTFQTCVGGTFACTVFLNGIQDVGVLMYILNNILSLKRPNFVTICVPQTHSINPTRLR